MKILGNLPRQDETKIGLALSGGIDSMCVAHFLLNGRKDFTAFYFNHGTVHGEKAEKFVREWCSTHGVPLEVGHINDSEGEYYHREWKGPQEYYRWRRYLFLGQYDDHSIILAHHLDDVLETWLFSTFHGDGKVIPYKVANYIRPFLLSTKESIRAYAERHSVQWIEDESNSTVDYARNRIRHNIVPEVDVINPGIRKRIARMVIDMHTRFEKSEKDYWKGY